MKIIAKTDACPLCKSSALVVGMQTGKIHVYGCLNCRNAQGFHAKLSDAKMAWKQYVATFEEPLPKRKTQSRRKAK